MQTSEVGPVPALLVSFLQQAVASINTIVGPLSACLPEDLVGHDFVNPLFRVNYSCHYFSFAPP